MWNKLIIACIILSPLVANSQDTLMNQDVVRQLENIDHGLGSARHIVATNNQFGFYVSSLYENDSIRTKPGSFVFNLGMQELWGGKVKAGYAFSYQFNIFRVQQDSGVNLLSMALENDKQNLSFSQVNLGPVIRFKLKNKGNKIGQYLDLGGYGSINFGYSLFARNKVDPALNNGASTIENRALRLSYMNRWSYGLQVTLGQNSLNLWAKYRLSDSFRKSPHFNNGNLLPDLPRLFVGIGFSVASIKSDEEE